MLSPIRIFEGDIKIKRNLIALLMGERERLVFAIEAARWFFRAAKRAGFCNDVPNYLQPTEIERAKSLLENALDQLDGIVEDLDNLSEDEILDLLESDIEEANNK